MNISLPATAASDVASSTTSVISHFSSVAVLAGGVFLGLFVVQFLINTLADRWYPRSAPPEHPPMM